MTSSTRRLLRPALLLPVVAAALVLSGCGEDADVAREEPASSSASSTSPSASPSPTDVVTSASPSEAASATPTPTSAPTSAAVPANAPDCATIWTDGGSIPARYKGCVSDGAYVEADVLGCSSGQRIVRFEDRFYGVSGGVVTGTDVALLQDPAYRDMVSDCRG